MFRMDNVVAAIISIQDDFERRMRKVEKTLDKLMTGIESSGKADCSELAEEPRLPSKAKEESVEVKELRNAFEAMKAIHDQFQIRLSDTEDSVGIIVGIVRDKEDFHRSELRETNRMVDKLETGLALLAKNQSSKEGLNLEMLDSAKEWLDKNSSGSEHYRSFNGLEAWLSKSFPCKTPKKRDESLKNQLEKILRISK